VELDAIAELIKPHFVLARDCGQAAMSSTARSGIRVYRFVEWCGEEIYLPLEEN
jgi:hypothetical protein